MMFSTFLLIGFFLIHSIVVNTTLDPSSAGIGSKLNTARFTPIKEAMFSRFLNPPTFIAFAVTVAITKYVSVGSLVLVTIFPIWIAIAKYGDPYYVHTLVVALIFMASAYYRHKENLIRIKNGNENKIGQRVKIDTDEKKDEAK